MKILYIGDIMARPGREVVAKILPEIRREYKPDVIIAQAENVTHGAGMSAGHMRELQRLGIDFFTGGNHSLQRRSLWPLLADSDEPVIAPLNMNGVELSWGAKVLHCAVGDVLIASLLGAVFPHTELVGRNPLQAIDELLEAHKGKRYAAKIINFHGDFSSEKRVIGFYLDGRASAVIGDHWHVPTADAIVLPGGTAHLTDVGMCGTLGSSLGVAKEVIIARWRDGQTTKNEIAEGPPYQFNAALVAIDPATGQAKHIELIHKIFD
ncbi:MAG TPA: TIGR00282 family metallophosphoesterase [Candidatus Acidoferrum sp.]|nr:TIGR00282 family metallophosphoesterase [Candidatus Acidoferrum sp.]